MKKLTVTILAAVLVLAISVSAQTPSKPFSVYAGGGLSMPMGDFSDRYKSGFHGTARIGFSAAPRMEILLGVDYHLNKMKDEFAAAFDTATAGILSVEAGNYKTLLVAADAKLNLGVPMAPVTPYAVGGIGIANVSAPKVKFLGWDVPSISNTKVFFEVGGGVEFNKFFLQGKLVSIQTEGSASNMLAFSAGLKI